MNTCGIIIENILKIQKKRLYSEMCLSESNSSNDENPRKKLKGIVFKI